MFIFQNQNIKLVFRSNIALYHVISSWICQKKIFWFFNRRYTVNLYFLYLAQVEVSSTNLNCKSLLPLYCNATMQIKTHLATFFATNALHGIYFHTLTNNVASICFVVNRHKISWGVVEWNKMSLLHLCVQRVKFHVCKFELNQQLKISKKLPLSIFYINVSSQSWWCMVMSCKNAQCHKKLLR